MSPSTSRASSVALKHGRHEGDQSLAAPSAKGNGAYVFDPDDGGDRLDIPGCVAEVIRGRFPSGEKDTA